MRNRDMPAHPVEGYEEVRWESDPPGGNLKSQRHDMKTGLTKRENAAIANMAQLLGSYGALPGEDEEMRTMARAAVKAADTLFEEMDQDGVRKLAHVMASAQNDAKG